jgi:hypothetical protein
VTSKSYREVGDRADYGMERSQAWGRIHDWSLSEGGASQHGWRRIHSTEWSQREIKVLQPSGGGSVTGRKDENITDGGRWIWQMAGGDSTDGGRKI